MNHQTDSVGRVILTLKRKKRLFQNHFKIIIKRNFRYWHWIIEFLQTELQ